jgi:hypothetical protein
MCFNCPNYRNLGYALQTAAADFRFVYFGTNVTEIPYKDMATTMTGTTSSAGALKLKSTMWWMGRVMDALGLFNLAAGFTFFVGLFA